MEIAALVQGFVTDDRPALPPNAAGLGLHLKGPKSPVGYRHSKKTAVQGNIRGTMCTRHPALVPNAPDSYAEGPD